MITRVFSMYSLHSLPDLQRLKSRQFLNAGQDLSAGSNLLSADCSKADCGSFSSPVGFVLSAAL